MEGARFVERSVRKKIKVPLLRRVLMQSGFCMIPKEVSEAMFPCDWYQEN